MKLISSQYIKWRFIRIPLCVFIVGIILTIIIFKSLEKREGKINQARFENLKQQVENSIQEHINIYDNALHGGLGLFAASKSVEPDEWRAYVESIKISDRYPGIMGMGVAFRVLDKDLQAFTDSHNPQLEFPIEIKSIDQQYHDEHFIVTYIEPYKNNAPARGLDLGSEKDRLSAAILARDTGQGKATELLHLLQLQNKDELGFLYFLPLYEKNQTLKTAEARRKAHIGFIYAAFSVKDFFKNVLTNASDEIDIDVYNGNSTQEKDWLFCKDGFIKSSFEYINPINLGGKTFTLVFNKSADFKSASKTNIFLITFLSFFMTTAVSIIFFLISVELHQRKIITLEIKEQLELSNQKLIQSQKMEAVGQLASDITHDFNNILGGIIGYASMIKSSAAENSTFLKYADRILLSANLGSALMKDLLTFARKDSSKKSSIQVNHVIEDSLKMVGAALQKNIHTTLSLSPKLWTIEADASQLTQVILNLCINARDAMPDGGLIHISTENTLVKSSPWPHINIKPGAYVHISVQDTGSGIPLEIREKIFEAFFTTKGEGKGTGLGLSMVASIIEDHHGKIFLDNEIKKGTLFHILLPVASPIGSDDSDHPEKLLTNDAPIAAR